MPNANDQNPTGIWKITNKADDPDNTLFIFDRDADWTESSFVYRSSGTSARCTTAAKNYEWSDELPNQCSGCGHANIVGAHNGGYRNGWLLTHHTCTYGNNIHPCPVQSATYTCPDGVHDPLTQLYRCNEPASTCTARSAPVPCPAGTWSNTTGRAEPCEPCPPGHYCGPAPTANVAAQTTGLRIWNMHYKASVSAGWTAWNTASSGYDMMSDGDVDESFAYVNIPGVSAARLGSDFGAAMTCDKVRFYSRASYGRVRYFKVQYSLSSSGDASDNDEWETVAGGVAFDGASSSGADGFEASDNDGWQTASFASKTARYWSLYFHTAVFTHGDADSSVSEVEWYCRDPCAGSAALDQIGTCSTIVAESGCGEHHSGSVCDRCWWTDLRCPAGQSRGYVASGGDGSRCTGGGMDECDLGYCADAPNIGLAPCAVAMCVDDTQCASGETCITDITTDETVKCTVEWFYYNLCKSTSGSITSA